MEYVCVCVYLPVCVCVCETGPGSSAGQSLADEAGQQRTLPAHLCSPAVYSLALHGLPPGAVLPLHLRQMAQGKSQLQKPHWLKDEYGTDTQAERIEFRLKTSLH